MLGEEHKARAKARRWKVRAEVRRRDMALWCMRAETEGEGTTRGRGQGEGRRRSIYKREMENGCEIPQVGFPGRLA